MILRKWIKRQKEMFFKEKELKYWKTHRERNYPLLLKVFNIKDIEKMGMVGDFGCGPYGGMTSLMPKNGLALPIDVLASEYNRRKWCKHHIFPFNGYKTCLNDKSIDTMFCCDVINHTRYPEQVINEMYRLLKNKGRIFLSVEVRPYKNRLHPAIWNERVLRKNFKRFRFINCWPEEKDITGNSSFKQLYAIIWK